MIYHMVRTFFRSLIFSDGRYVFDEYYNAGPVKSKEELNSILKEFERTFGELGVKTPTIEQIEKTCERSEKYMVTENKNKIDGFFS
jgi:hypothetical protein